jgi:hypothetical protein
MKAKFSICYPLALAISDSMFDAHTADGGYYTRLSCDADGTTVYTTSGGNRWIIRFDDLDGAASLEYSGSRWGFKDGCNAVKIEKRDGRIFAVPGYGVVSSGEIHLVDWHSSLPGNPGPFEDWQAIKDAENNISAYADMGEWIEASYQGWKVQNMRLTSPDPTDLRGIPVAA